MNTSKVLPLKTGLTGGSINRWPVRKPGLPRHPACVEFEPQNLGIVSINPDGLIIDANDAFLSMSGYAVSDLPLDMAAITPAEWHDLDDRKGRQLEESGQCLPWQKEILTRKGHRLPIVIGATALTSTEKRIQYFIANTEEHHHADVVILDYQSRLRNAAVELSLSKERERRAIAGDLHDNIGQELAIANLKLGKLRAATRGKLRADLDAIATPIANALAACRTLSHALATPSLYKLGLVPAIRNLVDRLCEDKNLNASLHFEHEDVSLSKTTKIILYRGVRELLINILKHSQAKNVGISGEQDGEMFKLVIVDDGIGCDVRNSFNDANSEDCLGLFLIRERMWHIGGSFTFDSKIGHGTKATLVAPVAELNEDKDCKQ